MARVYKDPRLFRSTGKVVWCIDFVGLDGERHRVKTAASSKELAQQLLRKKLDDMEKAKIQSPKFFVFCHYFACLTQPSTLLRSCFAKIVQRFF